jgi:hypothetical protein
MKSDFFLYAEPTNFIVYRMNTFLCEVGTKTLCVIDIHISLQNKFRPWLVTEIK